MPSFVQRIDPNAPPHPLVALGGLSLPSAEGEQPASGSLSPKVMEHTLAIAEAIFSDDQHPPPADRMIFVEREYGDLMARSSWRGRMVFTWAARIVGRLAPLFVGRFVSIKQLSLPERVEALRKIEHRPIGGLLIALKALLCIVYYEHPDAAREVGIGMGPEARQ